MLIKDEARTKLGYVRWMSETEYLYNELLRYIGEHPELATEYTNPPKQNRVDSITLSSP
jgi:hypothetical protein